MKFTNPFKLFKPLDYILWIGGIIVVFVGFALSNFEDWLSFLTSAIGITGVIFGAKGHIISQMIGLVFAVLYSVVAFYFKYYGELITYSFMTAPMAIVSIISWAKNPFKNTGEVKVGRLDPKKVGVLAVLTAGVTTAFYFILRALGNANLLVSTLSIATSFLAAGLTFLRSRWYAIAYCANDAVLFVLWLLAALDSLSYLPLVLCTAMFLVLDIYGFVSWNLMQKRQTEAEKAEETPYVAERDDAQDMQ